MLIKYGQECHLKDFMEKGEMYFNPCKYFRELEEKQKKKGIGDGKDGGIHGMANKIKMIYSNGEVIEAGESESSIIVQPALSTPIYCMRKCCSANISKEYRDKLRDQFPEHTHALLIHDEKGFLENVRYNMRNKVFAHDILYEDKFTVDFLEFICTGDSDILFYKPKKKSSYYMKLIYEPEDKTAQQRHIYIDHSNFYKTMYRKDMFFQDQAEYRLVLPREKIEKGKKYYIEPFSAKLVKIDDLVDE